MRMQVAERERTVLLYGHAAQVVNARAAQAAVEEGPDPDPRLVELMKVEPSNIYAILRLHTNSVELPKRGQQGF